ncbi:channel-forming protein, partial [Mycobacterium sp. ITM-2017-0098]
ALNEKLSAAGDFDAQMAPRILRDSLANKSVVIFRTPDAADDDIDGLTRLVTQAGGTVTGTVGLTQEFVDANSAEKLLSVVNSPIVPAGAQLSTASVDQGFKGGDLLGISLLNHKDPKVAPVDDSQRDTVLAALRDTGFITYGAQRIAAADTAFVVTGGPLGSDAGNQGATVARFAAGLAGHGSGTVLVGRDGSATGTSAVAVTRSDAALKNAVSTVDDVNSESGRITSVLALSALVNGATPDQFGIGQGATSVTVSQ